LTSGSGGDWRLPWTRTVLAMSAVLVGLGMMLVALVVEGLFRHL